MGRPYLPASHQRCAAKLGARGGLEPWECEERVPRGAPYPLLHKELVDETLHECVEEHLAGLHMNSITSYQLHHIAFSVARRVDACPTTYRVS